MNINLLVVFLYAAFFSSHEDHEFFLLFLKKISFPGTPTKPRDGMLQTPGDVAVVALWVMGRTRDL